MASMILRHWWLLMVLPPLFALAAGVWAFSQDRTYSASASFMPYGSDQTSSSGAASLARQFGVDVGGERTGQSPKFFADLLSRRVILRTTVESSYEVRAADGRATTGTLIDYYQTDGEDGPLQPWQRAVKRLRRSILTSVSEETGLVELVVKASEPALAEAVASRMLEVLQAHNLTVQRSRALEEGRFVSERLEEAQTQLRQAEDALERFLQQNRQYQNSTDLLFDYERLQRHVMMRQEVYTSLLRLHEQSRIDAIRDTPVLTMIDDPEGAAQPDGRGTILHALLGFLLGGFIAVFAAFSIEFVRRQRATHGRDFEELSKVTHRAVGDVRRLLRWWRPARTLPR
jgi:uncharacterized protein involved in exopolysaccharide biosynthesis